MRAVTQEELQQIAGGLIKKVPPKFREMLLPPAGGGGKYGGGTVFVTATGSGPSGGYGWGGGSGYSPPSSGSGGGGGGGSSGGSSGGGSAHIGASYTSQDGRHITITYQNTSDGVSSDQAVTARMDTAVDILLNSDIGVSSIDISATTNGEHTANSDHAVGDAVDINIINGVHVGTTGVGLQEAQTMEQDAMEDPLVRYVEGPAGNFARSSSTSAWVPSPHIPGDTSHVHVSVFRQ